MSNNEWNGEISQRLNLESITKYLTNPEFLVWIHGIWDKIIESIINYRKTNLELLQKLEKIWLNFDCTQDIQSTQKSKWSFCITGSFEFPRPKIIETMEENWYTFDSSPNKNTNYMLIGSKPGSKLTKAEELCVEIVKWRENITKQFPFLSNIKIEKPKQKWTAQIGLF
jgi:NAD-dependent DNA ligase